MKHLMSALVLLLGAAACSGSTPTTYTVQREENGQWVDTGYTYTADPSQTPPTFQVRDSNGAVVQEGYFYDAEPPEQYGWVGTGDYTGHGGGVHQNPDGSWSVTANTDPGNGLPQGGTFRLVAAQGPN